MKRRESSETRFGQVWSRSEPSSRGKKPFQILVVRTPENFKRPKIRKDGSDFDDFDETERADLKNVLKNFDFAVVGAERRVRGNTATALPR